MVGSLIIINLKLMHKKAKKGVGQSKNFGKSRTLVRPVGPESPYGGGWLWQACDSGAAKAEPLWLNLNLFLPCFLGYRSHPEANRSRFPAHYQCVRADAE